jgi:hypothetical protein
LDPVANPKWNVYTGYIVSRLFECLIVTKVSFGSSPSDPEWPEGRGGMVGGYLNLS